MSFFDIVNMKFLLCTEFIVKIQKVLNAYKVLIINKCNVDGIKLLISNWKRSTTAVEIKKNMCDMNWETFKTQDAICDSLETFNNINNTYLLNKCMYLIQDLIDAYILMADITKTTVQNLLPVMELLAKIDSLEILSTCRLKFMKKVKCIALFIKQNMSSIIYRETYFAYLKENLNKKLLTVSNPKTEDPDITDNKIQNFNALLPITTIDSTDSSDLTVTTADPDTTINSTDSTDLNGAAALVPLFSDIQDLVLFQHNHVNNLVDINSLRAVNKYIFAHYSVDHVKKIAIENLKSIIKNIFMLNSMEFIELLEQCGAIISGSTAEQCIHGPSIEINSDLDLYVPAEKVDNSRGLLEFLYNAGYTKVDEVPPVVSQTHYRPPNVGYRFNHSILDVTTLKHSTSRKKIQLITVTNTDGMTTCEFGHFVVSSFDFTFLKNFYDGTTLYIHDFYGIVKKRGSISAYVAQKLDLNNYPNIKSLFPIRLWYSATMATLIRVIKYQSRGYEIDNVPQFSLVKQLNL